MSSSSSKMTTGLLWWYTRPLNKSFQTAVDAFTFRFGYAPKVVHMRSPDDITSPPVPVVKDSSIPRQHLWLGPIERRDDGSKKES